MAAQTEIETSLETDRMVGEARLEAGDGVFHSVGLPTLQGRETETIAEQIKRCGGIVELHRTYLELLEQSERLLDFITSNVGPTEEWPLVLWEADESSARGLMFQIQQLNDVVRFLHPDVDLMPNVVVD